MRCLATRDVPIPPNENIELVLGGSEEGWGYMTRPYMPIKGNIRKISMPLLHLHKANII